MNKFDLTGKVALVTGGSRGLGKAMVEGFAEAGAKVAIVSRKLEACEQLAAELEQRGMEAFPYACHIGRWDDLEPMVKAVTDRFGHIDILVNNAGHSPVYDKIEDVTEAYFDAVIGVNYKGPFRLTALVASRMHAGRGGSIINISSAASVNPRPRAAPYAGAKAALNTIASCFAVPFQPNVRFNTLLVGSFGTEVAQHWADPPNPDKPGYTMNGRRIGIPEELVPAAIYLASDASSYTNGAVIAIDGGPRTAAY